jgi:hypothetical protein
MTRCDFLTIEGRKCKNKAIAIVGYGRGKGDNACQVHLDEHRKHTMLKPDKPKRLGR